MKKILESLFEWGIILICSIISIASFAILWIKDPDGFKSGFAYINKVPFFFVVMAIFAIMELAMRMYEKKKDCLEKRTNIPTLLAVCSWVMFICGVIIYIPSYPIVIYDIKYSNFYPIEFGTFSIYGLFFLLSSAMLGIHLTVFEIYFAFRKWRY